MSGRVQNAGLAVLLLAVVGLIGSAVMGVRGKPSPSAPAATVAGAVPEPPPNRPKVEVLNASGRSGLAKEAMHYLRDRGFDVVAFGNAGPAAGTATRVLVRSTDTLAARALADTLRIRTVTRQPDSTAMLDASVVLGKDWRMPGADSAAQADTSASPPHVDSAASGRAAAATASDAPRRTSTVPAAPPTATPPSKPRAPQPPNSTRAIP